MKVYVNDRNEIKAVESTDDVSLKELEINDELNPFATWCKAKILCYKVDVQNGIVMMMTPYVDTRIIEQLANVGTDVDDHAVRLDETDSSMLDLAYQLVLLQICGDIDISDFDTDEE